MLELILRNVGAIRCGQGTQPGPAGGSDEVLNDDRGKGGDDGGEEPDALAAAILQLPDGVVLIDQDGIIVWGNASAERMFGRTLDEWEGQSGLDLVHPDDREFVLRSLSTIGGKDVGDPIEIRIKATSGWRLVEIVGTTVQWRGQEAILLCLRDLTDRRRFEVARDDNARVRSLVHNAGSVIMLVSPSGAVESVSGAITRLLGHDPEFLEGRSLLEIVAEDDHDELETALSEARRRPAPTHPVTVRVKLLRHDGTEAVPFELSIVDLLDDPTVEGFVISAHDAAAQVCAEQKLGETLSLLTATLDSTADGILVTDTAVKITSFNRRFAEIWRIPEETLANEDDAATLAFALDQLVHPETLLARDEQLYANPESESFDTLEFKDGRVVERLTLPQRVNGRVVGRVLSFRDVTDRKRLEDELEYRAFHDPLTGLANKALFQDRLEHALVRIERTGAHLAVLFLDLDDLKAVNDSLGHGEGDQLLQQVATTLTRSLRPSDTAARLGGDEFAVLIEDVESREAVTLLAQRVLDSLRPPVQLGTNSASSACSIGIAFDEDGITGEELLRNADIAMYEAKSRGKDRFELFRDEMHAKVLARVELEDTLRAAIAGGDLLAHYQPIVELASKRIVGFEALVRWSHPQAGLVDPRLFLPVAEELGLIGQIDTFMLKEACRQAQQWRENGVGGPDLFMSVNLSSGQLTEPGLSDRVAAQIAERDFDPGSLILEITESVVLADDEVILGNLAALRTLGVRIALDDFGTGHSSFSHLARLPIDIVKIDRTFVQALGGPDDARSLVAAMLQLSETLGYQPIAEGVENEEQESSLRALGCGLAQGYELGRPRSAEATEVLLESRRSYGTPGEHAQSV